MFWRRERFIRAFLIHINVSELLTSESCIADWANFNIVVYYYYLISLKSTLGSIYTRVKSYALLSLLLGVFIVLLSIYSPKRCIIKHEKAHYSTSRARDVNASFTSRPRGQESGVRLQLKSNFFVYFQPVYSLMWNMQPSEFPQEYVPNRVRHQMVFTDLFKNYFWHIVSIVAVVRETR